MKNTLFWLVLGGALIILAAVVLLSPAERPVSRASGCYGGGGEVSDINGVKYCCPSSSSRSDSRSNAPCFQMDVQSGTCGQDMLKQCADWGLGCENKGFRDVCFKNWTCNDDILRACAADGWGCENGTCVPKPGGGPNLGGGTAPGGGTVVVRPDPYDRRSGDGGAFANDYCDGGLVPNLETGKCERPVAICESGSEPRRCVSAGEHEQGIVPGGSSDLNQALCSSSSDGLLCESQKTGGVWAYSSNRLSRIPKFDEKKARSDCDRDNGVWLEDIGVCRRKDGGGEKGGGGNDKNGLGCDVMRRCPDGKSFYGQKDPVTGNCTTIDSCPKRGGGGGSGGDGLVCIQALPPKPVCGFGEVATFYGQTDKECAKWVCEKISLPPIDECQPNSKNIRCIIWKRFEQWIF